MKSERILLALLLALASTPVLSQTATQPTLGAGTEASPYQISTVDHLYWISQNSTRWSLHYTQTANIDASATATWSSGAGFTPIGNNSVKFTGSYKASGRTITGLTINRPSTDYVGLFGYADGADIQNLTLVNVSITGRNHVGALAGYVMGSTAISSCHVNSGTVTGVSAGGLVGVANSSTVTLSSAKAAVSAASGASAIGGLVSQNINGTISKSYATGTVTGNGSTGGLLGWNNGGFVRNGYATGNVTGATSGGLVGLNQYVNVSLYGLVEHSYAIGTVTGTTYQGSLIGRHTANSVITNSYFNSTLSGVVAAVGNGSSTGATDLTTMQMRYKASFAGYDFTNDWYMLGEGAYFPTLVSNTQSPQPGRLLTTGSGTSGDPYLISNADELNAIRGYNSQYFKLIADIDLTQATGTEEGTYWNGGVGFIPISPPNSTLKVDGNGHTINGLYMNNTTGYTGLFGNISIGGYVRNLHLTNVDITSTGIRVGGIVASVTYGYVTNSSVTGSITINNSTGRLGGIAGELIGPTSGAQAYVSKSFTDVTLSGEGYYVGGIVGSLSEAKSVTDSYAIGSIQNTGFMSGGIAGLNLGTVSRTYAIGEIQSAAISTGGIAGQNAGTITDSYWNPTTTTRASGVGQGTLTGPTSLSASDMRQASSFAGFDFETTWRNNAPNAFPTLRDTPPTYPLPGYVPLAPTGSASLDGIDDWIDLPDSIAVALGTAPDLTLEAWVKMDYDNQADRVAGALFSVHTSSYVNALILFISTDAATYGKIRVYEPNTYEIESPQLANDTWIHVAYTLDGTLGTLYLDGELVGQHTMNTTLAPTNRWSFGQEYDNSAATNFSKLLVDEIRIWNRVRTVDELRRDMYQKLNGDEDGLVTYIPFDALTGPNPTDLFRGGTTIVEESHPYGTFVTGSQGWRLMGSPMESASYGTLFDPLWTQGFAGADVSHGVSNLQTWNEATRSYQSISNAADIPAAGAGFKFFFFDDEDKDDTPDGFPKQIRNPGAQRTGPVTPAITYTDSGSPEDDGWNLVGNPYGTSIDWNSETGWTRTNLDATFYIWNDAADEYQSWNGLLGTTALADGLIAPWQGFWVKANAADPVLTLTDEVRSAGAPLRKSTPPPHIRLRLDSEQRQSSTVVMFHPEAEPGKDRLDAYKLRPFGAEYLSLSTGLADGTALDIQALPAEMPEAVTIPLQLSGSHTSGAFGLNWELEAIPTEWILTLRDEMTGEQVRLNETHTYAFTVAATDTGSRFTLIIDPANTTGVEVPESPRMIHLEPNHPNPFNPTTVIGFQLTMVGKTRLAVYDLLGREVAVLVDTVMPAGAHRVTFDAGGLASGMYIYRLQTGGTILSRKMTLVK